MLSTAPAAPFTLRTGFRLWWRESLQRQGFPATLKNLIVSLWEVLRDCTPARRRMRFGDIDYDCETRVNTTWANVRFGTRLREMLAGRQYQPIDPDLFREVLGGLQVDHSRLTFLDLGSGKGRALLLATELPFRKIIGVELLPELDAIARDNLARYQDGAQHSRVELWCGDARQFRFPAEPLVVYLFDPFPEHILEQVIANLQVSVREQPWPLLIVYLNPISEHVLSGAGWLERLRGNVQYAVYQAKSSRVEARED